MNVVHSAWADRPRCMRYASPEMLARICVSADDGAVTCRRGECRERRERYDKRLESARFDAQSFGEAERGAVLVFPAGSPVAEIEAAIGGGIHLTLDTEIAWERIEDQVFELYHAIRQAHDTRIARSMFDRDGQRDRYVRPYA